VSISESRSISLRARKRAMGVICVCSSLCSMAVTSRSAFQCMSQHVWLANCPSPSTPLCFLSFLQRFLSVWSCRSSPASWEGTRKTYLPCVLDDDDCFYEGLCTQILYFTFEIIGCWRSHLLLFFFGRKNMSKKKAVSPRSHPAS